MEKIRTAPERYWIFYYLVYVAGCVFGVCRYWQQLQAHDWVLWLAAIFGASVGFALFVAIILEVLGRMVLLIPDAIRKIRSDERKRIRTALVELGSRRAEVQAALDNAEFLKILEGDTGKGS